MKKYFNALFMIFILILSSIAFGQTPTRTTSTTTDSDTEIETSEPSEPSGSGPSDPGPISSFEEGQTDTEASESGETIPDIGAGAEEGQTDTDDPSTNPATTTTTSTATNPLAPYYSSPQGELEQTTEDYAGVTPDSALHNLELAYENVQLFFAGSAEAKLELATEFSQERVAETDVMLHEENYAGLQEAVEETQESLETLQDIVENVEPTAENLELINNVEIVALETEDHIEEVNIELLQREETGEITEEQLEIIPIGEVEAELVGVQASSEETKDQITDHIAEEEGITHIEAELQITKTEEEQGLTELQQQEVKEELTTLEEHLDKVVEDLGTTEFSEEVKAELVQITEETKTTIQACESAFKSGHYSESFDNLVTAEDYINTLQYDVLESAQHGENVADVVENTADDVEEEQEEREEESKKFVEEYSEAKEEILAKYPDKAEELEYSHETSTKITELATKLADSYSKQFEDLKSEGKTEEEATKVLTERFAQEYRLVYGEEYHPPGITIREEALGEEIVEAVGGFVKGYEYTDPATGFKYEFTDNGYKYLSPTGVSYTESWPAGFTPPKSYENGNEVHSYIEKTPEGSRIYNYGPTGYEVVQPDGTTEAFAYPEGRYEIYSGEKVEITPHGYEVDTSGPRPTYGDSSRTTRTPVGPDFDPNTFQGSIDYVTGLETTYGWDGTNYYIITSPFEEGSVYIPGGLVTGEDFTQTGDSEGKSTNVKKWEYSPEFGNYAGPEGHVYAPDEGASFHHKEVEYSKDTGTYVYSHEGDSWSYDPGSNSWLSSSGQSYKPETTTVAPTGYESHGNYETASGKEWAYDTATGTWSSSDGQTYSVADGTYTTSEGHTWSYNPDSNVWTSPTGETHSGSEVGSEPTGTTVTSTTGAWTYDSTTGAWTSSSGESYSGTAYTGTSDSGTTTHTYTAPTTDSTPAH